MKKIILTVAVLMALATATYAQSNTSTVNQSTGERNTANIDQAGTLNAATVTQTGATTKDNKATIHQLSGKSNVATITEQGTLQEVTITQSGAQTPASNHTATVNISNAASNDNDVTITQAGRDMNASVALRGSLNIIIMDQSGTGNQAKLVASSMANTSNPVTITQAGTNNQTYATLAGNTNTITVGQAGTGNTIGTFAGGGALSLNLTIAASTPVAPIPPAPAFIPIPGVTGTVPGGPGLNIKGDGNTVTVTQGATTETNQVGVTIDGANTNTVIIDQLGTAKNNKAAVYVAAGQSGNSATIEQMGTAMGNEAGIYQEGSGDMGKITQTGNDNQAMVYQQAATINGMNKATISQSGNTNDAWINQSGVDASTADITQQSSNNIAAITQRGQGGHTAQITQKTVDGNRFVLLQEGQGNKVLNFVQKGVGAGLASDVEFRQSGMNNTIKGQTGASTVIRYSQTGNNNSITY